MKNSCFLIGHRESNEDLLPTLEASIAHLILNKNVRYFYVGGYGGFDRIATIALRKAKSTHPEITLMRLLAYHPAERNPELPLSFDGTYFPDGLEKVPKQFRIPRANKHMIDASDWLICNVRHNAGNSSRLFEYAKKLEQKGAIRIINLNY
jgi:uncharacterized phage-like protein YoqJ